MFGGKILSSCSFEVYTYSISFKLGRNSNSHFAAAHGEAWRSYCQAASDEDCPGLKLIIAYEIKLGANCCYRHIKVQSRSSKSCYPLPAYTRTERAETWTVFHILPSLWCLIYICMILFVFSVLWICCFKPRNEQRSPYKDHLHYYHISRIFKIFLVSLIH